MMSLDKAAVLVSARCETEPPLSITKREAVTAATFAVEDTLQDGRS